ncbi:TPM domain-containing protein [Archangium gephyra]|uniref:TPM domain-containing protein n=1 Tax=Archangium gephyra TaxID=48 RepID=UPI0035D464B8
MQDRKRALAWCVLVLLVGLPAMGATVKSIPMPEPGTWSVDTTGRLRAETLAELNRIGTQVNASGQGQLAIVMVDSTEGRQPRAFATELFNLWGIGNADRDDGALLFVAMDDRKVEIVLGDGVDSAEDVGRSDAVMASILPLFKQGDPDSGVLEGARGLTTLLAQHPPRGTPAKGMSLGGGSTVLNQLSGETSSRGSGGSPFFGFVVVAAVIAGIVALFKMDKNSRGPRRPRPPTTTYWGGGGFFGGGGGFSGGGGGGGGGFGGGGSSGGGSSGSF